MEYQKYLFFEKTACKELWKVNDLGLVAFRESPGKARVQDAGH